MYQQHIYNATLFLCVCTERRFYWVAATLALCFHFHSRANTSAYSQLNNNEWEFSRISYEGTRGVPYVSVDVRSLIVYIKWKIYFWFRFEYYVVTFVSVLFLLLLFFLNECCVCCCWKQIFIARCLYYLSRALYFGFRQ